MFEIKGDRPQWQIIYDRIVDMAVGEVIKYDELFGLLPDAPEGSVRGAWQQAVKRVEDDRKRTFANVRKVGYRMVEANEHEGLARGHHRRANRQLKRAKRKAVSADRSRLTREERARIDAVELNLSRQIEMTNRLSARMARVETDLNAAREEVKSTRRQQSTDTAALSDRLDRLEQSMTRLGFTETVSSQTTEAR